MKKLTIVALAVAAAASFTACSNKAKKAELTTDIDSLSYAAGVASSPMMKQAMMSMQIDSTYEAEVIKGIYDGIKGADDKKKAAYNAGIILGEQLAMMNKGASQDVFSGDSTQTLSIDNIVAGFVAGATNKNLKMTMDQARTVSQEKMMAIKTKYAAKKYGPQKQKADAFMAANAKKAGIKKLGKGVQYKVLTEGSGAIPKPNESVKINYELKTIDGKTIETTFGKQPATMPVGGVIPGFTEALTHMPVGSKWVVYIPYDAAYGAQQTGPIEPFSNLIFTIELLGVNPDPAKNMPKD